MSSCAKCSAVIPRPTDAASCLECKLIYHPECTRIKTLERFKKLPTTRKSSWVCDGCKSESSSTKSVASEGDIDKLAAIMGCIESMRRDMNEQFKAVNDNINDFKSQIAAVNVTVEELKGNISALEEENDSRKKDVEQLQAEVKRLREEFTAVKTVVEDGQQYSRRDNIEIMGVPFTQGENLYLLLDKIAGAIGVNFDSHDISVVHRLPKGKRSDHPPLLVRFVARSVRDAWMFAAKRCKTLTGASLSNNWPSNPIYLNDHLTAANKMLLGHCRSLVRSRRIAIAWSRNCKVYVRKTPDGPLKAITCMSDIQRVLDE